MIPDEQVEVRSAEELRRWLAAHHASSAGVWLVTWKKGRGPYVAWRDVVRELLCYGWIDARGRRIDEDRSALLVMPRKAGSGWSRVNKAHLVELAAEGRMQAAGRAAVDRAVADGSWTKLDQVETLEEPDDLRAALDLVPAARHAWDTFPPSSRRVILEWISTARRQPTRDARIASTVDEAAAGRRAR